MPHNKRQHYVPQSYLKRFSVDRKLVNIWNLKRERKIFSAPLKRQCYEAYFYGSDLALEKELQRYEGAMGKVFRGLDLGESMPLLGSHEHFLVLYYVATLYARTKYSADEMNEMFDRAMKHSYQAEVEKSRVEGKDLKFELEKPARFSVRLNKLICPQLLDLEYMLLVNRTSTEFVTSDNPVVFFNQLIPSRHDGSSIGMATRGLQIFFPIDPGRVMCFFDAGTYSFSDAHDRQIGICEPRDVDEINKLQMSCCANNVYFRDKAQNLESIHRQAAPLRRKKKIEDREFLARSKDGHIRKFKAIWPTEVKADLYLSFVRPKWHARLLRPRFCWTIGRQFALVRSTFLYEECQTLARNPNKHLVDPIELMKDLYVKNLQRT